MARRAKRGWISDFTRRADAARVFIWRLGESAFIFFSCVVSVVACKCVTHVEVSPFFKDMQDIQSMLPYVYIAFHGKRLSLKQSAMQYSARPSQLFQTLGAGGVCGFRTGATPQEEKSRKAVVFQE